MSQLFEGYPVDRRAWDEMLGAADDPRGPYRAIHQTLSSMPPESLRERAESLARTYLEQGVTFDFAGEERPFPLDAVPRVISANEWRAVERGVVQRSGRWRPSSRTSMGRWASVLRRCVMG